MLHEMMLTPRPFAMIEAGVKTIELRLNDEKRQAIKVGDWICFYCTEDHSQILQAEVVGLHYFDDFRQLYQHCRWKNVAIVKKSCLKPNQRIWNCTTVKTARLSMAWLALS